MSSLLPPNATRAERAIEHATARISDVPIAIADILNADKVDIGLLPWLAWQMSLDVWRSDWPEHIKRARVRKAIEIQKRKGTANSVRQVVAAFGGNVQIREWWQATPPGPPHTFEMVLNLAGEGGTTASAQFVDDVIAEVERSKPVRSHFTFTQGVQANSGVGLCARVRVAVYRRLVLQSPAA